MGNEAVTEDAYLEISGLTKEYDDETGKRQILKDFSLNVKKNEFLCILGSSGCGKTTLLRCIAGFESHTGEIYINGKPKKAPGDDTIMVFQTFDQLFPWKTVEKNIGDPLKLKGIRDKDLRRQMIAEALKKVRLSGYEKYYPHQLSGGMKQRVAIAKALALKPHLILMDEPFAALDALTRREIQNEMLDIVAQEECTILFVTHNIQEALILGTRSIILSHSGKIIFDEINHLPKPATPNIPGWGEEWEKMKNAIYMREESETDYLTA